MYAESKVFSERPASFLELVFISLTFFCLPLVEAPKNVFALLFCLTWVSQSWKAQSLGGNCRLNWPVWGLAAVLWISPLCSAYADTVTPLDSGPRWTLLALFVVAAARLNYSRFQLNVVLAALLVGGVVAVTESLWVWQLNGKPYPEFRSVGHVNHSFMYTLIPFAAGIGSMFFREKWIRSLAIIALASSLVFLPPSRSMVGGVSITAILIVALIIVMARKWSLWGIIPASALGVAVVSVVLMTPPAAAFRSELSALVFEGSVFSGRDKILYSALAVWDQHPLLGTGWSSFGIATSQEAVRTALAEDGVEYVSSAYRHQTHGHNLWTTMLIERGLVGVVLVTILLFLYFRTFLPVALSREPLDPADRGAAVGALLVAVGFAVAGLGNTTMMNEHGHAGMAFIAVVYGYLRGRGILPSKSR